MHNSDVTASSVDAIEQMDAIVRGLSTGNLAPADYETLRREHDAAANRSMLHTMEAVRDNAVKHELMTQRDLKPSWTFSSMQVGVANQEQVQSVYSFIEEVCNFTGEIQAPGLIIMGQSGSGKSHLAGAAAHELLIRGKKVLFVNFSAYMFQLLDDHCSQYCRTIGEEMNSAEYDVLFLDDVITGTTLFSDYRAGRLSSIIRSRSIANVSTVLTVNCPSIHDLRVIVGEYCFGGILDMVPHVVNLGELFFRGPFGGYDPLKDKNAPQERLARKISTGADSPSSEGSQSGQQITPDQTAVNNNQNRLQPENVVYEDSSPRNDSNDGFAGNMYSGNGIGLNSFF